MSTEEKVIKYANKSVEELLGMSTSDIDRIEFSTYPEGLYTGTVGEWELPCEDNKNCFIVPVAITGIIELENPDNMFELKSDAVVNDRYFRTDFSIEQMRTNWENFFDKVGGGILGVAMANGVGTEITFRIEHRYQDKDSNGKKLPKPKGPYISIKDVTVVS